MKRKLLGFIFFLGLGLAETHLLTGNSSAIALFWLFPLVIWFFLFFPSLIADKEEIRVPTITPPKAEGIPASFVSGSSAKPAPNTPTSPAKTAPKPPPPPAKAPGALRQPEVPPMEQIVGSPVIQNLFERFATFLSEDFTLANLHERLLEHSCRIIDVAEGQMYLVDPARPDFLQLQTTFPANPAVAKRERFSWADTSIAGVLKEGNQFFAQNRPGASLQALPPIPTLACTPIVYGKKILGALFVEKYASHFGQYQANPLLLFLTGQMVGTLIGLFNRIESQDVNLIQLKKEVDGLMAHKHRLEKTANYLDEEVDRQYFENIDLEKQRKHLVSSFQKFVSPIIIERIVQDPNALKLGGVKQKVTIFFSDIRQFTKMSEKMDPSKIVSLLNEYFSAMTDIVLKYEGTLDKFVGDELMALFGAPLSIPDAELRAVLCALEMKQRFITLKDEWKDRDIPDFDFGVGMNTGEVTIGFIGSEQVLSYTAIGDSVNLGARICAIALPGQILVSERTAVDLGDWLYLMKMPDIMVKGKEYPVQTFEVIGLAKKPDFIETDGLPPILTEIPPGAIRGVNVTPSAPISPEKPAI